MTGTAVSRPAPATRPATAFVSAGEPSGDVHGAMVARALRQARPDLELTGFGGQAMVAAGAAVAQHIGGLSAMGFAEAARQLPLHLRCLREARQHFEDGCVDLALLVDYPGLHLRVARAAAARRIPVLYYIAPQLWAWGAWRIKTLRQTVRHLAVILPFEEPFFRSQGIRTTFVGHPLLDRASGPSREAARRRLGVPAGRPCVAIFPGVRDVEVAHHWPLFRDAARLLRRRVPDLEVLVAGRPGQGDPEGEGFRCCTGSPATVLAAADAAIVKSGTATLEAALAGTPQVVAYRMHPLSYAVARRVVRCRHISLVNLVAGEPVVPEFVQSRATPDALAGAVGALMDGSSAPARQQREGFARVRTRLGSPGASRRVAELVLEML